MDLSTLLDNIRATFTGISPTTADYDARIETAVATHLCRDPSQPNTEVCVPSNILREILAKGSTAARDMYTLVRHCLTLNPFPGAVLLYNMYATVTDSALPGCTCKAFLNSQLRAASQDRYVQLLTFDQYWAEHGDHVLAQLQTTEDLQMLLVTYAPVFLMFRRH